MKSRFDFENMNLSQLKAMCRSIGRSPSLHETNEKEQGLALAFDGWDILEVAALMRVLKRRYDPLLTQYLDEDDEQCRSDDS